MNVKEKKNKDKKITYRFKMPEKCFDVFSSKLESLLSDLNNKEKGKTIEEYDLFHYFILNISDKDKKKIKEDSLSVWEKIEDQYLSYIEKTRDEVSLEEYVASRLKL